MNDELPRPPRSPRPKHPPLRSKHPLDLERHSRKCQICRHPSRELIEECFINWHPNWKLIEVFNLDADSFLRHAHAFDLYAKRKQNLRSSLEHIIERGVETQITGDTFLRALKAYVCLTDDNQWVEPATHVVFSRPLPGAPATQINQVRAALAEANPPFETPTPDLIEENEISNNAFQELETEATN